MRGRGTGPWWRLRAPAAMLAVVAVGLAGCSLAGEQPPSSAGSGSSRSSAPEGSTTALVSTIEQPARGRDWVVLVEDPAETDRVAEDLAEAGLPLTSINRGVGMVTVRSTGEDVRESAEAVDGVRRAVTDESIGWTPDEPAPSAPEDLQPVQDPRRPPPAPAGGDPLDGWLWGMRQINAAGARSVTDGSPDVRVGVIDTGVAAQHPDLVERVDEEHSRSFVTDIPELDGPCEHDGCVDPVGSDDNGHGTHVAGTIAASANELGVQGVAPEADIVDLRAGQDAGYFFLGPVVNAITAGAAQQLDVLSMSFYVDPWLYSCPGGAPEDSPAQAAAQDVTLTLVHRALQLAHDEGVTLVSAAGNNALDLAAPGTDRSSPNYGAEPHARTLGPECELLPLQGPHVIGVSAVDADGARSGFSNYTSTPGTDAVALAAPGGSGPPRSPGILSTTSRAALLARGEVDDRGRVTTIGAEHGIVRDCPDGIAPGEPDPQQECGLYTWLLGTSMAAPHVSGVAALVISASEGPMSPDEVVERLRTSARDHACPTPGGTSAGGVGAVCTGTAERNGFFGDGIVDAAAAVR